MLGVYPFSEILLSTKKWLSTLGVCPFKEILFSVKKWFTHNKEHIWVGPNEVDELRARYTDWSKSEREKCHILTHTYGN